MLDENALADNFRFCFARFIAGVFEHFDFLITQTYYEHVLFYILFFRPASCSHYWASFKIAAFRLPEGKYNVIQEPEKKTSSLLGERLHGLPDCVFHNNGNLCLRLFPVANGAAGDAEKVREFCHCDAFRIHPPCEPLASASVGLDGISSRLHLRKGFFSQVSKKYRSACGI